MEERRHAQTIITLHDRKNKYTSSDRSLFPVGVDCTPSTFRTIVKYGKTNVAIDAPCIVVVSVRRNQPLL